MDVVNGGMTMSKKRNLAIGGVVLAGISYVAGVLTAPKSGKETRKDLKRAALKAKSEAEKKLKKAHSELNTTIDEVGKKAEVLKGKANDELKAALAVAKKVNQKTREILSAVHEGEAHDQDLEKAFKEVKKAVKHLKSFARK